MTPSKSKLLLSSLVLVRVLLHRAILRPWTIFPEIKEKNVKIENLLTVGSIVYHCLMDQIRDEVPIISDNQVLLKPKDRVKPRKNLPFVTDKVVDDGFGDLMNSIPFDPSDEIIKGFYPKKLLKSFLDDRKIL